MMSKTQAYFNVTESAAPAILPTQVGLVPGPSQAGPLVPEASKIGGLSQVSGLPPGASSMGGPSQFSGLHPGASQIDGHRGASRVGLAPASRFSQVGPVGFSSTESGSEAGSRGSRIYKTVTNDDGTLKLEPAPQEFENQLTTEEKYLGYAAMVLSIATILIAFFCALGCYTYMEEWDFDKKL
ncbi:hypothetical protein L596_018318 [Steinernema carpocapsae]|uniref:Uncharacterized protein n=1 Tax=Steinernema carpocapsae TaxID=34508 RepID=A0A4U5N5B0_STECR|nr:hypothetical protein L596_018318 [Steinernema carpocapsae]